MKISGIDAAYREDFADISEWCANIYDEMFSSYFKEMQDLYFKLSSKHRPITDSELEEILSTIPLRLYAASEKLNELKLRIEVIKLHIKQDKHTNLINSDASSQTARREEAAYSVIEDELLLKVYVSLMERVESEITFSKELIMSAKKIWTARRESENVGTSAKNVDLPDYSDIDNKTYIK